MDNLELDLHSADPWHRLAMINAGRELIDTKPTVSPETAEKVIRVRMFDAFPKADEAAAMLAEHGGWFGVVRKIHDRMARKAAFFREKGLPVSPSVARTLANSSRILAVLS